MAKLSSIQKNLFRQKLIKKFKTKREALKSKIKNKNNTLIVLAWNFFQDIKKNNLSLSDNIINIKDLEFNK